MTSEQRAVSEWLYGLNRIEWALENLDREIDEIEHRISQGRLKAMQFDRIYCSNSNVSHPAEEGALAEFGYSGDQERLDYLLILRANYSRNLTDFESTLEKMMLDERWGSLAKDIIKAKYRQKKAPDEKIYRDLFCTPATFYRTLNNALRFFADVLPVRFNKKMIVS